MISKNKAKQIFLLFEEKIRKHPTLPQGFEVFFQTHLVQVRGPTPDVHDNWVYYSKLDDSNVHENIEATIRFYREKGHCFEWKLFDSDSPSCLKENLLQAGFQEKPSEALMVWDLSQKIIPCLNPSFQIREVQSALQFNELLQVQNEVWEEDLQPLLQSLHQESENNPDHLKIYQVYEGDKAVANGWVRFEKSKHFAGLFGGSTLPEYRRQGLYRQLVLYRALEAQRRGFRFLSVDASPMSEPILSKIGFIKIAVVTPMIWID